jgi:hypothetical protein
MELKFVMLALIIEYRNNTGQNCVISNVTLVIFVIFSNLFLLSTASIIIKSCTKFHCKKQHSSEIVIAIVPHQWATTGPPASTRQADGEMVQSP